MSQSCSMYDKKTLVQILSRQGITVPSDFFDTPRRADTLVFFEELLCLILGFNVTISTKQDLRVFLAEYKLNVSRGTLHPDMLCVKNFPIFQFVPDEGERLLTGISILMLYRYLQQFGNICGVLDVSLCDLLRPTPERIRLLASTAVDYILFQETYMPDALRNWDELERDRAKIEGLRNEIKEYREASQNISKTLESKSEEIGILRSQRQEATARLKSLGEKWVAVKEECDAVTLMQQKAENEVGQNNETIKKLERRLQDLKSQIVESPKRIQQTLEILENNVKKEEEKLKHTLERLPIVRAQIQIIELFDFRLTEAENILRSVDILRNKIESLQKEADDIDQSVHGANLKQSEVSKQLESLTKEVEKLQQADGFLDSNIAETQKQLEIFHQKTKLDAKQQEEELQALEDANRDLELQLPKVTRDIIEIQERSEEVEHQSNQSLAQLQARCHTLTRKLYGDLSACVSSSFPPGQEDYPFEKVLKLLENEVFD